jgi:hypothetical protein
MPKQFDNFGEVNKVDREYEKRTYFARAFVALDGNRKGMDAEDLEVFDYELEATSFQDAMGQYAAHQLQVAINSQSLRMARLLIEALQSAMSGEGDGFDTLIEYMGEQNKDLVLEGIRLMKEENIDDMPIPAGWVAAIIKAIQAMFDYENNGAFWQEPQLVMIGNPDLISNMFVEAKTASDVAEEGVTKIEEFLKDKLSNLEEE